MKSILVTGSNGLLGKKVVEALLNEGHCVTGVSIEKESKIINDRFQYISADLMKVTEIEKIFDEYDFSHIIHLAAIAHVVKGVKISSSKYYRVNTIVSREIFEYASIKNIPVFFSSTVDVYGIQNNEVDENTDPKPVGAYAKSKYLAEKSLIEIAKQPYLIARFAPIYTQDNKKDIRKRYYIKYPKVCYRIGKGLEYEFLLVDNAVSLIIDWCKQPNNYKNIINVCDYKRFNTNALIEEERKDGRAKKLVYIPQWMANVMKFGIKMCFSRKPFLVFTASKIFNPIRISRN